MHLLQVSSYKANHRNTKAQDTWHYTTFGSPMPTRTWSDPNSKYKYGFNGKEKDNETTVDGGDYDFGARIYDSRLGRWLSIDPNGFKFPYNSYYVFCNNSPLILFDPDGREGILTGTGTKSDPYIIRATYAYVRGSITEEMSTSLKTAATNFNKSNSNYTDNNGNKVYVKYQLDVQEFESEESLNSVRPTYDFIDAEGNTKSSLNIVNQVTDCTSEPNDIACASGSNSIGFVTPNLEKVKSKMTKFLQGNGKLCNGSVLDFTETLVGAMTHEIFHNLGGLHGDLVNGVNEMDHQEWQPLENTNAGQNDCKFTIIQNTNDVKPTKAGAKTLIERATGTTNVNPSSSDPRTGSLSIPRR